jgi:GTP-binding protein HflX
MRATKHEGAGNDFLVVLDPEDAIRFSVAQVRLLADRRRGIGADGIIRVGPGRHGTDLSMELHNADGGQAEMSGNGIRCLAQAAVEAGLVSPPRFTVATAGGTRTIEYTAGAPGWATASVDMGPARLGPDQPQEFEDRRARTVDVGNPHLVLLGPDTTAVDIVELGPKLQAAFSGRRSGPELGRRPECRRRACPQSRRGSGGDARRRRGSDDVPGRARAQGGRHRHPSGNALLSNVLPGTLIERTFRERIILVGVIFPGLTEEQVSEELDELTRLVDSAGADVVARVVQRRNAPDAATFVGRGKAEEIAALSQSLDADTVVFDDDLTPAQHRNLEKLFGRTAIDRTAVILDIFAQNARSPEGKAQVELALLRYRLPRLRGRGSALSQQAGGIGTRGPGETQLEVDRRRLVRRMHKLEADLREVERTRTLQRRSRARGRHRELALVGYTNAGKSTLLNRLTDAGVPAENRLFVTLDPRTRQLSLPGGETVLVTDTVGFVRKLPHELVEAFRSTLDSVRLADLIVHVVDSTAVDAEGQMAAVREVLAEIGASDVPDLIVVNKADAAPEEAKVLARANEGAVLISARTGEGVDELLRVLGDRLRGSDRVVQLVVPWARGDVLAAIHREGEVVGQSDGEESATLQVVLDDVGRARFAEFVAVP